MQVTAAVVDEVGAHFRLETVELSEPQAGEVLVEVKAAGLCRTDLSVQHGHVPFPLPGVLGHEGAGFVRAVGAGVKKVAVGDRVALTFNSCGHCASCADDQPAYCVDFMTFNIAGSRPNGTSALSANGKPLGSNFFGQSSFASHAIVNERNVVPLDDDIDLAIAAPLGCGVQTGAGAVMNTFDCQSGSTLLVTGGGSVGLSAVMAAAARDLSIIIVVEPVAERRELALQIGATHAIDPASGPLAEQVREIVPAGVNYIVDTTGNVDVLEQAFNSLAVRGQLGLIGAPADMSAAMAVPIIPAQVLGATVRGIIEGDSNPDKFIPELIALHKAGKFPFDRLIKTMPFDQINEAVAVQARGEAVKVVLVFE